MRIEIDDCKVVPLVLAMLLVELAEEVQSSLERLLCLVDGTLGCAPWQVGLENVRLEEF